MIYKLLPALVSCLYCPFSLSACVLSLYLQVLFFKPIPESLGQVQTHLLPTWNILKDVSSLCGEERFWVNISDALLFKKQIVV